MNAVGQVTVEVLGPLRVRSDVVLEVERPAQRRLLSILALAGGHRLSTDVLIDRFWPQGPPETARAAIQTHISGLRRRLVDDVIVTEGYGYRLNLSDHDLDVTEFTTLAAEAGQNRAQRQWTPALGAIEAALGLWRGEDAFTDLADDEFAQAERVRLQELHLGLLEQQAEALIALGRDEEALPRLEALVIEHPYRERLWEHLMTARYRLGRHTEALRAFQDLQNHLAEIGVEPGESLRRLEEKILLHDRSLTKTRHNLPTELDAFIGREAEIGEVTGLLAESRLVTLVGPGGSGKTRLATHTAHQLLDEYPDGVWFVELAPVSEPAQIHAEIAEAMGLRARDDDLQSAISRRLENDTTLIVLDNCEHLGSDPAQVTTQLLQAAPTLTVLATSRSRLNTPGERTYSVSGLSLPSHDDESRVAVDSDAVRLFVERSGSVADEVDPRDIPTIVEICHRLDGLPLAIELAAARSKSLSFGDIADRLDSRFGLLTDAPSVRSAKHRTLEAAIDWSFQLLTADQQTVFSRLSAFRGAFDLDMAERVAGFEPIDETRVAGEVSGLVEGSLVALTQRGPGNRYRLLETLREFGIDRLRATGDYELVMDRHLQWAVEYSIDAVERSFDLRRDSAIEDIGLQSDNLLAAIGWAEETGVDPTKLRIAVAIHWDETGYLGLATHQLVAALRSCDDRLDEALIRALLWRNQWAMGHPDLALSEAARAYELMAEEPGSKTKDLAIWVYVRGITLHINEDTADALPLAHEGVSVAIERGAHLAEIQARRNLSQVLVRIGCEEEALQEANKAVDLALELGDSRTTLIACYDAITTAMYSGAARRHEPRRLVDIIVEQADTEEQVIFYAADWLAQVYLQNGEFDLAAKTLEKDRNQSHLEGMGLESLLLPRAGLHWMRGDLAAAVDDVEAHQRIGVNPRWYQDYYAVKAEIYADRGDLNRAHQAAKEYLHTETHDSEEPNKLGALNPLVRAQVDAALAADDQDRHTYAAAAEATIATMERILSEFPPLHTGAPMWETHNTHLIFAKAELSRLGGSGVSQWREARDAADFIYYRLYAQWRLAQALLQGSDREKGATELKELHRDAKRIGASLLTRRGEITATEFHVALA